jgi:hypothetical protein
MGVQPPPRPQTIKDVMVPDALAEAMPAGKDHVADQERIVKLWFKRITGASDIKKKWEDRYEIDRSHDYVLGFARATEDEKDAQSERKYQLNKILAALKAKIPSIFYYHPYFRVRASGAREDTPAETVTQRAQVLQDTINTVTRQPKARFKPECLLALKEAQWAFGIVEDGYAAEWIDNPFLQKPTLIENKDAAEELDKGGEGDGRAGAPAGHAPQQQPAPAPTGGVGSLALTAAAALGPPNNPLAQLSHVPATETFYARHIPARQFIVSSNDRSATETLDWLAYWEWQYVEDVKRIKSFENTENLKATAKQQQTGADRDLYPLPHTGEDIPPDMVRIWKLWDQREKKRYVLAEGHDFILKKTDYKYLPLHPLRMEVMPGEWYPVPPIFSQLGEQDEFNDSREFLRMMRKTTRTRFMYDKKAFSPTELNKFETDEWGTFIGLEQFNPQAIIPVPQPSLSADALKTLSLSEQGFSEASGVSGQARQLRPAGGTPTATEVNVLQAEGDVRESYEQQEVADWLADVARGIMSCAIEKMTISQWVLINSDPYSPYFQMDAIDIAKQMQQITQEQLEDADATLKWDVTVDVESMSPVSENQQAARLVQFLNMLNAPGIGMLLSLSPQLLKRTMDLLGIRNAADQKAIADALAQRQQMMAAAQAPPQPGLAPMPGSPTPPGPPGAGAAHAAPHPPAPHQPGLGHAPPGPPEGASRPGMPPPSVVAALRAANAGGTTGAPS